MKSLLILFLGLSLTSLAQNNSFPNTFVGKWTGNLEVMVVDSTMMDISMSLNIQPTENDSIYKWEMTYVLNDTAKDVRAY